MEGVALRTDFPEDYGLREEWKNHFEKEVPGFFPSAEENRRLWQEIEIERALDYHPAHEVHASNLPDYHYWPAIMNDLDQKQKFPMYTRFRYHRDKTEVPRFHKCGTPKTPLHEQPYYVPLSESGTFDWRKNLHENGIPGSLCSVRGWDKRYIRMPYRSQLAMRNSGKWNMIYWPETFGRHIQLTPTKKLLRAAKGSYMSHAWLYSAVWIGVLGMIGGASYANQNWNNHPWNPDIHYLQMMHNFGMIHSHYRD